MVFKRWGLWEVIGSWGWSPHKWDCCSDARSCLTLCNLKNYSTLDSSVLHYLLEFDETHVHWVSDNSNNLILCYPLLFLPSIFPSGTFPLSQLFASCGQKYWSFNFSNSTSNEYSGLISFQIDWLDILAVQGTVKSLVQHHNLKASILHHSDFFIVQISHLSMTTGRTIVLTIQTFFGK